MQGEDSKTVMSMHRVKTRLSTNASDYFNAGRTTILYLRSSLMAMRSFVLLIKVRITFRQINSIVALAL